MYHKVHIYGKMAENVYIEKKLIFILLINENSE